MMKKFVSIAVLLIALLVFSGYSYAQRGAGPQCFAGLDPQKAQQYCKEIQPLYEKYIKLRGELFTLWAQPNPDWNAIRQKEQERANLKVDMRKKAYEMGLSYGMGVKRGLNIRRVCGWQ